MLITHIKQGLNTVDRQFSRLGCLKEHKAMRYIFEIIVLVTIVPSPETFALWGTILTLIAL